MGRQRVPQKHWCGEGGDSGQLGRSGVSPPPGGHLLGHQRQWKLITLLLLRGAVLVSCIKEVRDTPVPAGPAVSLGRLEQELERGWRVVVCMGAESACVSPAVRQEGKH